MRAREDQRKMKTPGLCTCVLLMTALVNETSEAGSIPQLEGIDHWFDRDQDQGQDQGQEEKARSRILTEQAEMAGSTASGVGGNCKPDWMETIRNDIQRLSDRIDMKGATLDHRRARVEKCQIMKSAF